ncbi:hypothetical protein [Faecalimonas umbilicata]|uniref:hypothetical protein n=1 Tax=Faecalimonas umbilicata TaxID=1912855 RepID=UPI0022E52EA3|nr:hypothetical protein [Faecalimonas umbilicata]
MSKINTEPVRKEIVAMINELKNLVLAYMANKEDVAKIEGKSELSREYKDTKITELNRKLAGNTRNIFDRLQAEQERLGEALRTNDGIYDFSDPEFASCIALLSATEKELPYEIMVGIADKFLGNRQALLALIEVAKGANKDLLSKKLFNTETEMDYLQEKIIDIGISFPESIYMIPILKDKLVLLAKACGEKLTEEEKDMGTDYQEIVTMQMKAAMGLPL